MQQLQARSEDSAAKAQASEAALRCELDSSTAAAGKELAALGTEVQELRARLQASLSELQVEPPVFAEFLTLNASLMVIPSAVSA